MDDVMYFLLGSVKELREGFISVLFPAEGAPKCGGVFSGDDFMLHGPT